ncbi:DUF2905 domain-containing protein [Methylogaea oryzae]|uniref:DUF2905 domain-containing protein n=1 Tax=Methylogaea oryzae TaxID=1295382 RepID=A0A8D4VTY1_9GAMM|nr:DUF2905 domain-containing protein [Methylogaea oryzae]BBL72454.1 hypothetical protein MoryE10_30600 [Methylogaea oryzae]
MNSGKFFVLAGLAMVAVGLALSYAPGLFSWFGRLPGDIRIEEENRYVFIPITSMIVISLALTLILNLFFRR